MRILFIQETDWLKRNPAQQHHLAEMLALRGHEIHAIDYDLLWRSSKRELFSRRQVFPDVSKIHSGAKITVFRPGILKLPWLEYLSILFSHQKEIKRQLNEFQPDVIVGWSIVNSYLSARLAKEAGIPFVYYWIDVLHRLIPTKALQGIGKLIEKMTLKQSDLVLVINDRLKDFVLGMGAPSGRTRVLRAGVSLEKYDLSLSDESVKKQYGLKSDDIILFFMGWLYHFSGLKEVALELAKVARRDLKLLIVGEGDAYLDLRAIVEKHNLSDRVILTGKKNYEEIPAFIAAADVCLLPAYPREPVMQDIVPIKLYEYMAMQKPVVTTKLPGVMTEFGEGNGVIYVDRPEDVVAKSVEIVECGQARELGRRARSFVERNSWDKITDEFERILEIVVKEKKRTGR